MRVACRANPCSSGEASLDSKIATKERERRGEREEEGERGGRERRGEREKWRERGGGRERKRNLMMK